jgi:uncharacterized protein DUF2442
METSFARIGRELCAWKSWSRSNLSRRIVRMLLRVTSVEPLDGYRLRLTFNDGVVTEADFSNDLDGPLAEELRDPAYFRRARVDEEARTVVWPNGLDPDPYVLHGDHPPADPSALKVRRISPPAEQVRSRNRSDRSRAGHRAPAVG